VGALAALEPELAGTPGTVSVWCARLGAPHPVYAREEHVRHYAASTMKLAVLVAAHRAYEAGTLDLDSPVPIGDHFTSAVSGDYVLPRAPDDDPDVWHRLGRTATLRWLVERMIVTSSNLATNAVLEHVGLPAAHGVWALVGARDSGIGRGIDDAAARTAGITNEVTAVDLAALLEGIVRETVAGPLACAEMLTTLCATRHRDDIAAGLPAGARLAHKSGWITGVRHGAAVVYPPGREPYTLVVCTSTALPDSTARRLLARIATASWTDLAEHSRSRLFGGGEHGPT
jgi:beta-lactamase class A